MKKLIFSAALVLSLGLAACGNDDTKEKDTPTPDGNVSSETESKQDKADTNEKESGDEVGEVTESELGKLTVLYKDKELNLDASNGPVNAMLNKIQLATLETNEESKDIFDGLDIATIITIEASTENTVDETTNYYIDQATIVTDTGQQVDASLWLSDDVGGEFLGEVKKEGNIIWILKHDEDIKKVTLHISGASNGEYNRVGEDFKLEIPLDK